MVLAQRLVDYSSNCRVANSRSLSLFMFLNQNTISCMYSVHMQEGENLKNNYIIQWPFMQVSFYWILTGMQSMDHDQFYNRGYHFFKEIAIPFHDKLVIPHHICVSVIKTTTEDPKLLKHQSDREGARQLWQLTLFTWIVPINLLQRADWSFWP